MATDLLLRKHQFSVRTDFKNAAAGRNKFQTFHGVGALNARPKPGNDGFRQTGGARRVVSLDAKGYFNDHSLILASYCLDENRRYQPIRIEAMANPATTIATTPYRFPLAFA